MITAAQLDAALQLNGYTDNRIVSIIGVTPARTPGVKRVAYFYDNDGQVDTGAAYVFVNEVGQLVAEF